MKKKSDYVMCIIASPSECSETIAEAIVSRKLAACAQVFPGVASFYWWNGELRKDSETLIYLKTKESAVPGIERLLPSIHPYEVPELIVLPVTGGLDSYLGWIDRTVTGSDR